MLSCLASGENLAWRNHPFLSLPVNESLSTSEEENAWIDKLHDRIYSLHCNNEQGMEFSWIFPASYRQYG